MAKKQVAVKDIKESSYRPSIEEKEVLHKIRGDWEMAVELRNHPYEEFNDMSLIDRMNINQKAFNSYVPPRSADPDESWRANIIRPITRNRTISVAAHVTGSVMTPKIFAQNERDDEDKDAAIVMSDLFEWANEQSNYERVLVSSVISMLVNPAAIVYDGYRKVMRKKRSKDGIISFVKDEESSGFVMESVPLDEIYYGNFYEHYMQNQPYLIWRRFIEHTLAEQKYGNDLNFEYVRAGIRVAYSNEHNMFYDQYDDELEGRLVEELVYYNKYDDLEIVVLNGVVIGSSKQRLRSRTLDDLGYYPFAKGGFGFIDEGRFVYYKSLVDQISPEQGIIDTLYNMIIDGTYQSLMPPAVVFGNEEIDSSIITPGSITTMSADSRVEMIKVSHDLRAGLEAMREVDKSISEGSVASEQAGIAQGGRRTAREAMLLDSNAKTMFGLFAKMVAFFVEDFAKLRINNILRHMTVADADELLSPNGAIKFRNIILNEKIVGGKKKTKKIEFTDKIPSEVTSREELDKIQTGILEREVSKTAGSLEEALSTDKEIALVNPNLFRKLKFLIKVSAENVFKKSEALEKALNLEAYDRAVQNPIADQEAIYRDFLIGNYKPGEADKYVRKDLQKGLGQDLEKLITPRRGATSNLVNEITGGGSLGKTRAGLKNLQQS